MNRDDGVPPRRVGTKSRGGSESQAVLWIYAIVFCGLIGFALALLFGEEPPVDPECGMPAGVFAG